MCKYLMGYRQKNTVAYRVIIFGIKTEIPVKSSFTGITSRIRQENKILQFEPDCSNDISCIIF